MATAKSKDGTLIAFEKKGSGSPLIIVSGALSFRKSRGVNELYDKLSESFEVMIYDRRGRGESGDTKPYSVNREIDDLDALIDEAGGSANLYGVSSGAALAFYAAKKLGHERITGLALYEPPFGYAGVMGDQAYADNKKKINGLVNENKNEEAVITFFEGLRIPKEQIDTMKNSPGWKEMESVGHTLVYDYEILDDGSIPLDIAEKITIPTLILDGENSFDFMHATADKLASVMPNAKRKTLEGQTHELPPEIIAPVLQEFFAGKEHRQGRERANYF